VKEGFDQFNAGTPENAITDIEGNSSRDLPSRCCRKVMSFLSGLSFATVTSGRIGLNGNAEIDCRARGKYFDDYVEGLLRDSMHRYYTKNPPNHNTWQ
jgi:hypothetical protein